jgi:hypothetical protein
MLRRTILGVPVLLLANQVRAATHCKNLNYFLSQSEIDLSNIDSWVATEGKGYVETLEGTLADIEKKASDATLLLDQARLTEFWNGLSFTSAMVLAALGVSGAVATGPLFVVGFGVSATLLMIQVASAPKSIDAIDHVVVDSASKAELLIDTWGAQQTVVSYKAVAADLGGKAVSFFTVAYTFNQLIKAGATADNLAIQLAKLQSEAKALQTDILAFKQPGNLRLMKKEQLDKLKARLKSNIEKCVEVPPPG